MYETIIVLNYMICEKTPAGNIPVYNTKQTHISKAVGSSLEECQQKVKDFLQENNFVELKK